MAQDRLPRDEDAEREEQVAAAAEEVKDGEAEPNEVRRQCGGAVAHHVRVLQKRYGVGDISIYILQYIYIILIRRCVICYIYQLYTLYNILYLFTY